MSERSSGGASFADISFSAAGGALLVFGFLWGRELARRRTSAPPTHLAPAAPPSPPAAVPRAVEEAVPSSIMKAELARLAGVAVSHGPDDPAIDVFLAFVAALDPLPDAATLKPAAQQIGELRLMQALDRPGEPRLGARRLLAAASDELPGRQGGRPPGIVTAERPVETGRRFPELFEALLHAIRVALGLFV